jgi:hypothetical protein
MIRRRATYEQGRALETLGHAIEYLVDSSMFDPEINRDGEAVQILAYSSRQIFSECAEVVPMWQSAAIRIRSVGTALVISLRKAARLTLPDNGA